MKIISPSVTVTINDIAGQKKLKGEKVYNFSAGDPVLCNHPKITEKAVQGIKKGFLPYPPVEGIPELRGLAAQWVNATCRTAYVPENVLTTCGGKFALFAAVAALLQGGEEVLIHAPYWVSYPDIVRIAGGIPKTIRTEADNDWKLTPDLLRRHITKNTKILLFNNACNPTGTLYSEAEIGELLEVAKTRGLIVISDEVYSGLVYGQSRFISCGAFPEHRKRVLVIQSCSKNFAMTGWRIGFILAEESFIKQIAALQSNTATGVCLASQWAAVGALENADEVNAYVKEAMRRRRDVFINTFSTLFPLPGKNRIGAICIHLPARLRHHRVDGFSRFLRTNHRFG